MTPYVEITEAHVGKLTFEAFGRSWWTVSFIGRILPRDVGKRVYLIGGDLQVENDQQRAERVEFKP